MAHNCEKHKFTDADVLVTRCFYCEIDDLRTELAEAKAEIERLQGCRVELPRASIIINKLARLVDYYGYAEEMPPLRRDERKDANVAALTDTKPTGGE